jgi:hypothetical protein
VRLLHWFGSGEVRAEWRIDGGAVVLVVILEEDHLHLKAIEPRDVPLRVLHDLPYESMLMEVVEHLETAGAATSRSSARCARPAFATLAGICGHNAVIRPHPRDRRAIPPVSVAAIACLYAEQRITHAALAKRLHYSRQRVSQLIKVARKVGYLEGEVLTAAARELLASDGRPPLAIALGEVFRRP